MTTFNVNDMTCGHCVGVITKALKAVDPDADLRFDLATHRLDVVSGKAGPAQLSNAITEAGYTPVMAADVSSTQNADTSPKRSGCCCR